MTDDRTLLEKAAKAAGIEGQDGYFWTSNGDAWNPLTDDGDALRLAVTLGLVVDCSRPSAAPPFCSHTCAEVGVADTAAATRRAIVRAAAALSEKD